MTDAELRDLVAATVSSVQETSKQLQELGIRMEKSSRDADERLAKLSAELRASDERLAKLSAELRATDERLEKKLSALSAELKASDERLEKKLSALSAELKASDERLEKKLNRLAEIVGGISNNNGYFAEDMFIASLEKNPVIGNIRFDTVHSHFKGASRKGFEYEYDVCMQNGAYIGLVEIKYRLHPENVRQFALAAVPRFKEIFPQFADKKIVGAVAAASIPDESVEEAIQHGIAVMAQEGQAIRFISDKLKEY